MSTSSEDQNKPTILNQPQIGNVTGQVHAGIGDINVHAFNVQSRDTISTKDDFLAALRELMAEIEAEREQGLPQETTDDTIIEVEAAEREAKKKEPKQDRIIHRLEKAKALLTAGTGLATVAATSVDKLVPLIENAIHAVSKLF